MEQQLKQSTSQSADNSGVDRIDGVDSARQLIIKIRENVARLGEGARLAEAEEHHTDVGKGKNTDAVCVSVPTKTIHHF